jgi:hypothetical protein
MKPSTSSETIPSGLLILSTIGFVLGLINGLSYHYHYQSTFVLALINAWGILAIFSYDGSKNIRLLLSSALAAFCIAIMIAFFNNARHALDIVITIQMFISLSLATYMIHSFHWAYHRDNGYHYQYSTLFYTVWNSFCLLIFSCVFSGLAWGILYLSANLFTLVHINFLKVLLLTTPFTLFIFSFLFSVGIFLGRQRPNIIDNLRWLLLQLFRYLYPFLAIMVLAFLIISLFSLEFLGSHPFSQHITLFSNIALLGILFINASYQDGNANIPYSKYLFLCIKLFMLTLPLFAILGNAPVLFNSQNIPYPSNLIVCSNSLFLIVYPVAYAIAVLYSKNKKTFSLLPRFNISIAIAFILVTLGLSIIVQFSPTVKDKKSLTPAPQLTSTPQISPTLIRFQQGQLETDTQNAAKALEAAGITWTNSSQLNSAIVLGYRGKDPLYACKIESGRKWVLGELFHNKCSIVITNTVKQSGTFQVLTGQTKKIGWDPAYSHPASSILLGGEVIIDKEHKEVYSSRDYICRTIYNNRIYIGRWTESNKSDANGCFIVVDNTSINIPTNRNPDILNIMA